MRRWQRRWIFRSGSEKTLLNNKRSPLFENKKIFLRTTDQFAILQHLGGDQQPSGHLQWDAGQTWSHLRTSESSWQQSAFLWEHSLFLENKVLFLENKVFSWEQSIFPENKVLVIDQGLTKTCSPGEALPRHQTPWEEQSGRSELQEAEARHNRRTAKPSWTGGRPAWHRFQTLFCFQTLSGSKLRIIAITYTGQPEPFFVHFKAKGKCICTDQ